MTAAREVIPYLDAFRGRPGAASEPNWLVAAREAAIRRFGELGFPTRKQESWRFTDLSPLTAAPILPGAKADAAPIERMTSYRYAEPSHLIVLVNGFYVPELSNVGPLPKGAFIGSTAEALKSGAGFLEEAFDASDATGAQPFASLNAALFEDGFVLALDPGIVLDAPVNVLHFGNAAGAGAFHIRNAVHLGAGSSATIIETATGTGAGWTNAVTAVAVGAGASVRHVKVQDEAAGAIHFSMVRGTLAQAARYETFVLTMGARLSREDIHIAAAGEGACTAINGAYLLRGDREAIFAPFVDHRAAGCRTSEVVKGLIQDRAHGVFLGKMAVRPGADGTDAHQLNRNLLLTAEARVDTKPELEIFADEVKCSHGATVGDLDEAALFYLQARGISEAKARHMLMEAFIADAIEKADLGEGLCAHLKRHVRAWLDQGTDGL